MKNTTDKAAWDEFSDRYRNSLVRWAKRQSLQDADAEDLTQTILMHVFKGWQTFDSNRNGERVFRRWLVTVAKNACSDFLNSRNKHSRTMGWDAIAESLASAATHELLSESLDEILSPELLQFAFDEARRDLKGSTWESFHLWATQENPTTAQIAAVLGISTSAVSTNKSRALIHVRRTLRRLGVEIHDRGI